jgi:hypothetical protein
VTAGYYFGRIPAVQIDFFAFPRCGSHFLRLCTAGLFDLVALPHADSESEEAARRRDELDPAALYALNLREDGVPYHPVWFNATANGRHGTPVMGRAPVLILIRDPHAAVYSLYRVSRDRWNVPIRDARVWARAQYEKYGAFNAAGEALLREHPGRSLLVRYEDLRAGPEALERLVEFVGVRPKLSPAFVHRITRFETLAREGERTFYREADNDAWRRDQAWGEAVRGLQHPDFAALGYGRG